MAASAVQKTKDGEKMQMSKAEGYGHSDGGRVRPEKVIFEQRCEDANKEVGRTQVRRVCQNKDLTQISLRGLSFHEVK